MKEGWKIYTIENLSIQLFAGGDVPKKSFSKIKTKEYNIPIYSNGIENEGLYGYTNSPKVIEPALTVAGRGTIGYVFERNTPFVPVVRLITIVPDISKVVLRYFYYALKNIDFTSSGSSIPQLTVPMIRNKEIPLPPLEEQHRIVSILDASFEKIDALKKNAEENLKNAKALFQQVLAQELKPKEGWVEKKFENIVVKNEVGLVKNSKEQSIEYKYPYLKMGNITSSNYLDMSSIVNVNATEDEVNRYSLVYGDFLFNTRNSKELVGKSCVYNRNDEICLYNNNIIRFNFINEINPFFINYLFSNTNIKEQLEKIKKGTTNVWAIYYKELRDIIINIPSLETQHRIVSILDTLSEKCRRLEEVAQQTTRECDALKQSILRQAFSGEL